MYPYAAQRAWHCCGVWKVLVDDNAELTVEKQPSKLASAIVSCKIEKKIKGKNIQKVTRSSLLEKNDNFLEMLFHLYIYIYICLYISSNYRPRLPPVLFLYFFLFFLDYGFEWLLKLSWLIPDFTYFSIAIILKLDFISGQLLHKIYMPAI